MSDPSLERVVHAIMHDGSEIVRYDWTGKWYREFTDETRELLTVSEAAWLADSAATVYWDQYGGKRFNQLLREER